MSARVGLLLAAMLLAGVPLLAIAQEEAKSLSCVKDVVYSPEFLARYPKAGAACREVVMKEGQKWVRFDADVVGVSGNQVTADFMDNFGKSVGEVTFEAAKDAMVNVNGRDVRYSDLKKGDMLTFWVPESRMGFYAAPNAAESGKLAVVDQKSKRS